MLQLSQIKKKLLICDLDNTLYDWVGYFVDAFYSLVDETVEIIGCDREQLLDDFRQVHRRHHDAEHPFAILETETVRRFFSGKTRTETAAILDPALYAFNSRRKKSLTLYPSVRETLDFIKGEDISLVAHTESKLYAVVDRLTRLDLARYFDRIYCRERPDSIHPFVDRGQNFLANFPMGKVYELSQHQRKPNREVLLEICAREGALPSESVYIGDSMARDVLMAKRADVTAVWAKYGTIHKPTYYDQLVRISHWTQEDIDRERALAKEASSVVADFVAEALFRELLPALGTVGSPAGSIRPARTD